MVGKDVKEARKHLNFSEIGGLSPAQQQGVLFESISQIELGAMPLPSYRVMHPESTIPAEQLAVLKKYLSPADANKVASAEEIHAADEQYEKWVRAGEATPTVAPAPNGIAFMPEYKDWKAISTTERFDNHTL